jgi:sugar (pentulose or hexulose) kinase
MFLGIDVGTSSVKAVQDYLRLFLIGDRVSEMSDAAGTLWLDVAKRDWSDALLAATGLTREHMPRQDSQAVETGSVHQITQNLVQRRKLALTWCEER